MRKPSYFWAFRKVKGGCLLNGRDEQGSENAAESFALRDKGETRSATFADGTLVATWAQNKSSPGLLYGDIHPARITLRK